jgi:hypothetical protein
MEIEDEDENEDEDEKAPGPVPEGCDKTRMRKAYLLNSTN